jgi:hypothetical protein
MMKTMKVQRNGEWLSAMMGEECAMMSIDSGNYVTLSRVGTRIWELLEPPTTVSALCERLVDEFEVPAPVCRAEVDAFLAELARHQAVTLSPVPA